MNIMVIAGYDVLAEQSDEHRDYVEQCCRRAILEKADLVVTIGGATNPNYPEKTEGGANANIAADFLSEHNRKSSERIFAVASWPFGQTSAESLASVREYLMSHKKEVDKLILCAEMSRLAGFMADALQAGVLDFGAGERRPRQVIGFGVQFSETFPNFKAERKKALGRELSHRFGPFMAARNIRQKLHQRRTAKIKKGR